jgi:hypothetical protein
MSTAISDVQRELDVIKLRVQEVEQAVKHLRTEVEMACDAQVDAILVFTKEMFQGDVQIFDTEDPEIAGRRYLVFEVTTKGSVDELAALDDQWHRRLSQIADRNPGRFALSIIAEG